MASPLLLFTCVNTPAMNDLQRTCLTVRMVESSGGTDPRDGDGGRAVGPLQIHPGYVRDVNAILAQRGSPIRYSLADRRDDRKSRQMFAVYVTHWCTVYGCPKTPQSWSRIHNGGPRGAERACTLPYWQKVQTHLK